ncbi:hypothetical protein B5S33_g1541 [[Candida] boidinii]|nr:hypothetical protein B5S33_g1541 [[Candida] boidinii]
MSERKAINKYYPPDFDPLKLKKKKKKQDPLLASSWASVRLMAPFSMRCTKCGEYIAKMKKFNAKKENTKEDYLGVKIVKFHIKCPMCYGEIVFKTDPKTSDFVPESGAVRNYDPQKKKPEEEEKVETMDQILKRLENEEINERMASEGKTSETTVEQLEKKLKAQQQEQDMIDEIEYIQEKNSRIERSNQFENSLIKKIETNNIKNKIQLEEEDQAAAQKAFADFKKRNTENNIPIHKTASVNDSPVAESEHLQEYITDLPSVPIVASKYSKKNSIVNQTANGNLATLSGYGSDSDSDSDSSDSDTDNPLQNNEPITISIKKRVSKNQLGVLLKKRKA